MKRSVFLLVAMLAIGASLCAEDLMRVSVGNAEVSIPVGWYAEYRNSGMVFVLYSPLEEDDSFQENGNLATEALDKAYSVKDYMAAALEQVKTVYENFSLAASGKNYHVYTGTVNNVDVTQIQYFYIKGKTAYVLTFTAKPDTFDDYSDTFAAIAKTFVVR
jgi:hypothetical protein